jgi:acylphosphatase
LAEELGRVVKRAIVRYTGRVQNVGFRYTVVDLALKDGITGWVRNTPDGGVELTAEGEETLLKSFLAAVSSVLDRFIRERKISWAPATGEFHGFIIR